MLGTILQEDGRSERPHSPRVEGRGIPRPTPLTAVPPGPSRSSTLERGRARSQQAGLDCLPAGWKPGFRTPAAAHLETPAEHLCYASPWVLDATKV